MIISTACCYEATSSKASTRMNKHVSSNIRIFHSLTTSDTWHNSWKIWKKWEGKICRFKLGLLGWLENFRMKFNNSKVREFLGIWNKWKEQKIYGHITRLPMPFFQVAINKLSWPPMKTFPNCFWQYMLQKLRKAHQERT